MRRGTLRIAMSPGSQSGRRIGLLTIGLSCLAAGAATMQSGAVRSDPERFLAERLQFTGDEVATARSGQPVAKLIAGAGRNELAIAGAVRLEGDKTRLAAWIENIAHFRGSAQLGVARVVDAPPTVASFADLVLDAADLASLQRCTSRQCDLHLSARTIGDLTGSVQWQSPDASRQATDVVRAMLAGYARAYLEGGDAAIGNDFAGLLQRATNFDHLAPALASFLRGFPAEPPAGTKHRLYWSSFPTGKASIVSLHHLVIHQDPAGGIVIADKTIYASRYFDVGALVLSLQDSVDGRGYYLVAASRMQSSDLTGAAASLLRRQIQRAAVDTVKTYLEWVRDSLAISPRQPVA
jgi:hypothetical protein